MRQLFFTANYKMGKHIWLCLPVKLQQKSLTYSTVNTKVKNCIEKLFKNNILLKIKNALKIDCCLTPLSTLFCYLVAINFLLVERASVL